jgi:hypothetical protein
MQIIEVNGEPIEFPDDMSDDEITAVIQASQPAPPPIQPQMQQPVDDGFSVGEMVGNIPSSAANLVGNLAQTVMHPIETAKGVGRLGAGALYNANEALSNVMPESLAFMSEPIGGGDVFGKEYEEEADIAGAAFADRYGGLDETLSTLEQDPVGALADVAGVVSGVGALSGFPAVAKAGAALNPLNAAMNTSKYAASKLIPEGMPANLYERAAKFSTTLSDKDRGALIDTAMDRGIMPTSKGVRQLDTAISAVDDSISNLINKSASSGETIPAQAVFKHLNELRDQKGGPFIEASSDLKAIDKFAKNMATSIKRSGKDRLTAQDLQDIKRDTYSKIAFDAKRMKGSPIKEDTYKAIAKGAKEGVEQLVPEAGALNREFGAMLELKPHLQRAAGRIENRDVIPIKGPLNVAAGGSIDPIGAAAGGALSIFEMPKVSARIGLILNEVKKTGVDQFLKNNPSISNAELSAIIAGESMGGALSGE